MNKPDNENGNANSGESSSGGAPPPLERDLALERGAAIEEAKLQQAIREREAKAKKKAEQEQEELKKKKQSDWMPGF